MAAEGQITSDIVKNAMFYAANEINTQFESIPKTFKDGIINIKNNFLKEFEPVAQRLSSLANSRDFDIFSQMAISTMVKVINVTVSVFDTIAGTAEFIKQNWNTVGPLIGAVAFATLGYKSSLMLANFELVKNNILQGKNLMAAILLTGKNFYLAASTFAYTVAQEGLNAALYACPITWIVGGIAAVITIIYGAVSAFNALTGKSISATGIITGGISMIAATVVNMGITIWNALIMVAEFFVNVWLHPIYSVKKLFFDFILDLIGKLMFLAKISDKILGTDLQDKLNDLQTSIKTNLEVTKPDDYIDSNLKLNYVDTMQWGGTGYNHGANIFKFDSPLENDVERKNQEYLAEIAKNTSLTNDKFDLTSEEIEYMRDLAEMKTINRFTTAEIKVEVGGITNQVNNEMDLDSAVETFTNKLKEAVKIGAEGVYE